MEWDHLVGQQVGQYEVLTELGQGTYGYVYQAFQPRLRRYVAIKALHISDQDQRGFLEQFEQIAQTIAQLNHPNIVSIYDFGEEQGLPYIVMQSVTGGNFRQRLGKPIGVSEAVTPIIQLARALHHAHQRGVLHLDVRPENILIDQENASHLLLTDFSLSQLFQPEYQAQTGLPIGAPAYLAPEQIEGLEPTARTDVYALGALLFEALAGKPAFSGPSAAMTLSKQLHEPPPYIRGFNPSVPRELARIVSRALAKQPGERYESAEALARALEPYRDTKERDHRLHLSLEDLNIIDDDDTEEDAQAPKGAPSRMGGQAGQGNQRGSEGAHQMAKASLKPGRLPGALAGARGAHIFNFPRKLRSLTEPPALPENGPVIAERVSLVNMIGLSVFRLAHRMVGKSQPGQWIERTMGAPVAQGIAGISAMCLALFLSLAITLLAVSAPAQGNGRNTSLSVASQPTPTPTATATPSPIATATPSPSPTPSGPIIDPQAAAAIARVSAALSIDNACQINPNGAALPAGRSFYITVCFNAQAISYGGAATLSIVRQGSTTASANQSARIGGGSSYFWFQFGPLASGSYTIEVFWNGKLGRISLLTLS
ncbi:MAG TPA: serine/threonine-protein kinase [Ktedonobacterales bacterium]|nr:serine/threonine-protein kinase [Ktedonobacterales bacterium]